MQKSSNDIEQMIELFKQGKSNREIARQLNTTHSTVGKYLELTGYVSNTFKNLIELDKGKLFICSKCGIEKPSNDFFYGRKGTSREYRFNTCKKCRQKEIQINASNTPEQALHYRMLRLKGTSKREGIPFDLTDTHLLSLWERQKGLCFYTDIQLEYILREGTKPNTMSVDKIIPEKGYTIGNVVLCAYRINIIKLNVTLEEMKIWMPVWYERLASYLEIDSDV